MAFLPGSTLPNASCSACATCWAELLGLRYVLGMNSGEIGAHLCLSPEGVRSRLQRLLTRMRKDLDDG